MKRILSLISLTVLIICGSLILSGCGKSEDEIVNTTITSLNMAIGEESGESGGQSNNASSNKRNYSIEKVREVLESDDFKKVSSSELLLTYFKETSKKLANEEEYSLLEQLLKELENVEYKNDELRQTVLDSCYSEEETSFIRKINTGSLLSEMEYYTPEKITVAEIEQWIKENNVTITMLRGYGGYYDYSKDHKSGDEYHGWSIIQNEYQYFGDFSVKTEKADRVSEFDYSLTHSEHKDLYFKGCLLSNIGTIKSFAYAPPYLFSNNGNMIQIYEIEEDDHGRHMLDVNISGEKTEDSLWTTEQSEPTEEQMKKHEEYLIKTLEIGDTYLFGKYEQDNDTSNGNEDIEWIVLDKEENKILLISKYALASQPFNTSEGDTIYADSSLRYWLNEDFLETAFSSDEADKINTTHVVLEENPEYGTRGGQETIDKVFILNIGEARKYFSSDIKRECEPTPFVKAQKKTKSNGDHCNWWLRTGGYDRGYACYVRVDGDIDTRGMSVETGTREVDYGYMCVRPAIWVTLIPDSAEESGNDSPDELRFGKYEQDNNFDNGKEDIEWIVLDEREGKKLVVSKYALDTHSYHSETTDITWEECTMRKWLNSDFLDEAFSDEEKAKIEITKVINADVKLTENWTSIGGNDTEDRIFLLSYDEFIKYLDKDMVCIATDYALEGDPEGYKVGDDGNCTLWSRSMGIDQTSAMIFNENHKFSSSSVGNIEFVRPVLWINTGN